MSVRSTGAADAFAKDIADAVADRLQSLAPNPPYYDQNSSPLGKAQHLREARNGTFPSWKVGKLVLARREDVHAFIEHPSHAQRPRVEPTARDLEASPADNAPPGRDPVEESLRAAGLGAPQNGGIPRGSQLRLVDRTTKKRK